MKSTVNQVVSPSSSRGTSRRTKAAIVVVMLVALAGVTASFLNYKSHSTQYNDLSNAQAALLQKLEKTDSLKSQDLLSLADEVVSIRTTVDDRVAKQLQSQYDELLAKLNGLAASGNQTTASMASQLIAALSNQPGEGIGVGGSNNTTVSNKGVISINNQTGAVSIQGKDNQTSVTQQGKVTVVGTAQDIAQSSSPTFNNQNLSGNLSVQGNASVQGSTTTGSLNIQSSGTQNGHALCDASNNCGYSGAGSSYVLGGNSFGSTATIGTNDNNSLNIRTNGQDRIVVGSSGNTNFTGNVSTSGSVTANSFSGDGSNVTGVDASRLAGQNSSYYQNASNMNAGTLQDSRLSANVTLQGNSFNGVNQLVKLTSGGILPVLDGSQLTNVVASNALQLGGQGMSYFLNASNMNAGTLSDALLSSNVTLQGNSFNGPNQLVKLSAGGILPILDGSQLTNIDAKTLNGQLAAYYLNASNFGAGTLADARLSTNVVLKNATNTFTGTNNFAGLTATGILQNGYGVCDASNNCNYASSTGGAGYIQNQTAVAQAAGFNINGSSYIGGSIGLGTTSATKKLTVRSDTSGDGISLSGSGDKVISMQRFGNQEVQLQATGSDLFKIRAPGGFGDIASFNLLNGSSLFGGSMVVQGGLSSPGAGLGSERLGVGALASTNSIAIGTNASSLATGSIAVGYGANSGADNTRTIAIGQDVNVSGTLGFAVAIGDSAKGFSRSVVVGPGAECSGYYCVALGRGATGVGNSVAVGQSAAAGTNSTALGYGANASQSSIAIGHNSTTTGSRQLVVGSSSSWINDGYFGSGVTAASPQGFTLNATGGSGTDIQGANLTLAGGRGTGSAAGGNILFQTAASGASGVSLNNLVTRAQIAANGNMSLGTTANLGQLGVVNNNATQVGLVVQGAAGQTANLQEWRNSAGTVSAHIGSDGSFVQNQYPSSGNPTVEFRNGIYTFRGAAPDNWSSYLSIKPLSGNTAELTSTILHMKSSQGGYALLSASAEVGGNSAGHSTASINTSGGNGIRVFGSNSGRRVSFSNNNPQDLGARINATTDSSSTLGLVLRGYIAQTADLLQAQDSAGAVLAKIAANGNLTVKSAEVQGDLTVTGNATFAGNYITFSNNVRGRNIAVNASNTTQAVTFATAHADANYAVFCTPNWNTSCFVTNKTTTGFTLNYGTAAPAAQLVDWLVAR